MPVGTQMGAKNPFDLQKEKVSQRMGASAQQNIGAIQRRFAAQGGTNSGAAIKAQQLAQDEADRTREEALGQIDIAQAQDSQARADRLEERQANQGFQSAESEKQRGFQREQSGLDRGFQEKVFNFDSASKLRQMDTADKQFGQQFGLQKDAFGLQQKQFDSDRADQAFNQMLAFGDQYGQGGVFGIGAWGPEELQRQYAAFREGRSPQSATDPQREAALAAMRRNLSGDFNTLWGKSK